MDLSEQTIRKNIELITEKLSISNEVTSAANRIYQDIPNEYSKYPYKKLQDGLYYREGQKEYTFWGHTITVVFQIYDFTDQQVFDNTVKGLKLTNEFDRKSLTLTISIIMLFGMVYKELTEDSVYHEIEHFFQWCMKKNNNPQWEALDNQAYSYANINLQTSSNDIVRMIAWIVYYSRPSEQDAFVHEYYIQSRNSMRDFRSKSTIIDQRLDDYEYLVRWLNKHYQEPEVQWYLERYRQYGYTPKNILTYANKGVKRFKNKVEHVRKLINITSKDKMPFNKGEIREMVKRFVERWARENS